MQSSQPLYEVGAGGASMLLLFFLKPQHLPTRGLWLKMAGNGVRFVG